MGPGACCFGWVGGVALGGLAGLALALVLERVHSARRVATVGDPEPAFAALSLQLALGTFNAVVQWLQLSPARGWTACGDDGRRGGGSEPRNRRRIPGCVDRPAGDPAMTVLFPLLAADAFWQELSPLGLGGVGGVLDCPLKGLVFLTMLMTVGVGGVTAPWLAKALGLNGAETSPEGDAPLASAGDLMPR